MRGKKTYAALESLRPHSLATSSKFGVSLVAEFLMHDMRIGRSASLNWGAMFEMRVE